VWDPLNGITTTAYDAAGRVTSETDPLNNTTLFKYDLADRQVAVSDPLKGIATTI
jgi:YD repeat-containing protein